MTMQEQDLKDRVALVTGAGSGLGEATAKAFAGAGCRVACLDRDREAAERVAREIRGGDIESMAVACDVSDEAAVFAAVKRVLDAFGRLDIVVNNAAVDYTVSIEELTVAEWDRVTAVNLRAPFLFAKAALPEMRRQQWGHFFNVASTAATRAWGNAAAYHATKWGLVGFTRGLGVEGRPDKIKATTVIPGGMRTHFFDRFVEQGIPLPQPEHLQDPANVAAAMVFAARMPVESVVQEIMVTPLTETSWP